MKLSAVMLAMSAGLAFAAPTLNERGLHSAALEPSKRGNAGRSEIESEKRGLHSPALEESEKRGYGAREMESAKHV